MPKYETVPLNTWWMQTEKTPEKRPPKGNRSLDMTPFFKLVLRPSSNMI